MKLIASSGHGLGLGHSDGPGQGHGNSLPTHLGPNFTQRVMIEKKHHSRSSSYTCFYQSFQVISRRILWFDLHQGTGQEQKQALQTKVTF